MAPGKRRSDAARRDITSSAMTQLALFRIAAGAAVHTCAPRRRAER